MVVVSYQGEPTVLPVRDVVDEPLCPLMRVECANSVVDVRAVLRLNWRWVVRRDDARLLLLVLTCLASARLPVAAIRSCHLDVYVVLLVGREHVGGRSGRGEGCGSLKASQAFMFLSE